MAVRFDTTTKTALKLCWRHCEGEFGMILNELHEHRMFVEDEAKAAATVNSPLRLQKFEIQAQGTYLISPF
jgi:hypothetical protein